MAQSLTTPYHDIGVYLPYCFAGKGNQWGHDEKLFAEGFLLIEALSRNEFVVQSIGNGKMYLNKLLEGGGKDFTGARPPELKISTAPTKGGSGDFFSTGYADDPQNKKIKDRMRASGWWRPEETDVSISDQSDAYADQDGSDEEFYELRMEEEKEEGSEKGAADAGSNKKWYDDILNEDDTDMDDDDGHDENGKKRDLEIQLSDAPCFAKLMFWQRLAESPETPVYSLYFEHANGGTLANLRDRYRAARRRVPEHFIWHVAQQLGYALASLHYGLEPSDFDEELRVYHADDDDEADEGEEEPEKKKPRRVFHRNLLAHNVSLHYLGPKSGPKRYGERTEAFPEIRLGGFGGFYPGRLPREPRAGRLGERGGDGKGKKMKKGKTDAKVPSPKEWEDVAGLGMILRELATTHVTGNDDASNSNDADGDEDRVNRVRVADANEILHKHDKKPRYWPELTEALERFEWKGMTGSTEPETSPGAHPSPTAAQSPPLRLCDARPDGTHGYDDLPDMEWVVHKLLPSAQSQVKWRDYHMSNGISTWEAMGGNYKTGDVSWTRPSRLMPFACGGDDGHGVARLPRLKALLEPWDELRGKPYEFVKISYALPKPSLDDLAPSLEAALRNPAVQGSSESSDGEENGRSKRARTH
ncbi:hypothetical protein PG995_003342 [Apiospora arundinis]